MGVRGGSQGEEGASPGEEGRAWGQLRAEEGNLGSECVSVPPVSGAQVHKLGSFSDVGTCELSTIRKLDYFIDFFL